MKYLALLLLLPLGACVTSGDLQRVSAAVATVEGALEDESASVDAVEAAIAAAKEEIGLVAQDVEERTRGAIDTAGEIGGLGGLTALASAIGLNLYRNKRRKDRGEKV